MKHLSFLFLFLFLLIVIPLSAQELSIKSFAADPTDLTASLKRRNDANGDACALVQVQLAHSGAKFSGNVVGQVTYDTSIYSVYMTKGSKRLDIQLEGHLPLSVVFPVYGVNGLEPLTTYKLTLSLPQKSGEEELLDKYLVLSLNPKDAHVFIEGVGDRMADSDGMLSVKLNPGRYICKISAIGYEEKTKVYEITDKTIRDEITLQSNMAQVTVICPTQGAEIYVNEIKKGVSQWSGMLLPDSYTIEARLAGFATQRQTLQLRESEKQNITFQKLQPLTGQLDIIAKPMNADVYLDGKLLGPAPDVFSDISVGQHHVEIRKQGYISSSQNVSINEGQTSSLSFSLEKDASAFVEASASPISSGNSASPKTFTVKGVSFTMVPVEGATFTMGTTEKQKDKNYAYYSYRIQKSVTLPGFYIGETEVTQALWTAVMETSLDQIYKEKRNYGKGDEYPMYYISWDDCQKFIERINEITGLKFRLPSSAEWEFAARGGIKSNDYRYSGSDNIKEVAWCHKHSNTKTHLVKQKKPNELGIYDMSGNVAEWCSDWEIIGTSQTNMKITKGGAFEDERYCQTDMYSRNAPDKKSVGIGFRLLLDIQ